MNPTCSLVPALSVSAEVTTDRSVMILVARFASLTLMVSDKSGAHPEPAFLDGRRFQSFEQHGFSNAAQPGQHHVVQDGLLFQQPLKLLLFGLASRQIGWHVASAGPKRVWERSCVAHS
ncbi:hypothetical protein ACVWZV_000287 [Bradyrhizobium sp. GM5.1]